MSPLPPHGGATPTTPNPQTLQYLTHILSQRGPTSLPYPETHKWLIRQHLISLSSSFPSLVPKSAPFPSSFPSPHLLLADGTLPVPFHGVVYNIPVIIWLTEMYPRHPPRVYVNPTRDMVIKQNHGNVGPDGEVRVPGLINWVFPGSNLVDLGTELIHFFSIDPPVYSRVRPPSQGNSVPVPVSSNEFSGVGFPRPMMPTRDYGPHPHLHPPYGGSGIGRIVGPSRVGTDDPSEVFRRNSVNKLVEMVHGDVVAMDRAREGEMEGLMDAQRVLRDRGSELEAGLKEMRGEMEGLERRLQVVTTNGDVLEEWVRENEGKVEILGRVGGVDEVFECCDGLSRQMMECMAADLAIEDVIYSLDRAVQDGVVSFDMYLRNVRLLSREQFMKRATAAKVKAAQTQAQVAAMASRMSQFAV